MGTWSWRGVAFRLVLASAIGAALVTGGAVGHADPDPGLTPNEQQFVNNLASIGVTPTAGSRGLVGLGYHFCSELSSGKTRCCRSFGSDQSCSSKVTTARRLAV